MMPIIIRFVAAEVGAAITTFVAKGVKTWALHKAGEWIEELVDLAVLKITGKSFSQWETSTKELLGASIDFESVRDGRRDLTDLIMARVLSSSKAQSIIDRYRAEIEDVSGVRQRREEWLINQSPIPREMSVHAWAKSVASALGLTVEQVLARRSAS